jgi:hypothetical protein
MGSSHTLDQLDTCFDDTHAVANAGLLLAATLAERALSVLAAREQRWELYERLAVRAGVDLSPPQLWLLARLGERAPTSQERLLKQLPVDGDLVTAALQRLREQRLVGDPDGLITLTVSGRADYERLVAARCAGLRELLTSWAATWSARSPPRPPPRPECRRCPSTVHDGVPDTRSGELLRTS